MKKRLAIIGIFMKNERDEEGLNALLKEHYQYLITKNEVIQIHGEITILSIVLEAPENVICALTGRIGMLKGIHSKVIYAKDAKKY